MFDRLTSSNRRLWTTLAATGALFLVVTILLGVQMALGRDPSMGDRTANRPSPGSQTQAQGGVQQQAPDPSQGYGGGYDDQYGGGYDDGQGAYGGPGYDDGSGYPQQQAPQQQGPPLQSGTS